MLVSTCRSGDSRVSGPVRRSGGRGNLPVRIHFPLPLHKGTLGKDIHAIYASLRSSIWDVLQAGAGGAHRNRFHRDAIKTALPKGPSCPANSLVSGSLCAEPCCSTISTIWRRNHALVASVAALLTVALLTVALLTVPLLTEAALLRVTTVAALLTVAWVHSGRGGGAY